MPANKIIVWNDGEYDPTRWISIIHRGAETCLVHLSDACLPGKVSRFGSVTLPARYLKATLESGALQITVPNGHALFHRDGDVVRVEFRASDESTSVKVDVLASDLLARLTESTETEENLALSS